LTVRSLLSAYSVVLVRLRVAVLNGERSVLLSLLSLLLSRW
jgi:hypothetical protein